MGLTYVTVSLKSPGRDNGTYEALFLVGTGATDSMAPSAELAKIGIHGRNHSGPRDLWHQRC